MVLQLSPYVFYAVLFVDEESSLTDLDRGRNVHRETEGHLELAAGGTTSISIISRHTKEICPFSRRFLPPVVHTTFSICQSDPHSLDRSHLGNQGVLTRS